MISLVDSLNHAISQVEEDLLQKPSRHPDILKMVGQEHLKKVRNLDEGTFDLLLWLSLNRTETYHRLIVEDLKPGFLWAQKESAYSEEKNILYNEGVILWSTEPGWIHHASLSDEKQDEVKVRSYIVRGFYNDGKQIKMTIDAFRKLIGEYLNQTSSQIQSDVPNLSLTSFRKHLELLTIVCKITRSACEKLAQLREKYSNSALDMSLIIGVDKSNESYHPMSNRGIYLIEISKYFLNGRLPFLNEKEGKPNETSEPVAPVFRSWEAVGKALKLRKMTFGNEEDADEIFHLAPERRVSNLSSLGEETYEVLRNKNLKDLHTWLVLVTGKINYKAYQFEELKPEASRKEKLELSIDFKDETWKLKSKYFEKVKNSND